MKFLEWYNEEYLNEETDVIVMLPERDIRYLLQPSEAQEGGSPEDAVDNFKLLIGRILDLFGDRLVGWYAIDEPELFEREDYLDLDTMLPGLRLAIRQAEREWREAEGNDPDYLDLTEAEREAGLLPVMITFSFKAFDDRVKRRSRDSKWSFRKWRDIADIFLYDEYPYKRQWSTEPPGPFNLREEILAGTSLTEAEVNQALTNSAFTTLLQDPERVLNNFNILRKELNENTDQTGIIGITNPAYRHAALWGQGNGSPYDHSTIASWSTTPAPNLGFLEGRTLPSGVEILQVGAQRGRRLPSADEIRYFSWMALFFRSEGMPIFSQYGISNQRFLERFVPVAQEIDYFSNLRMYHDFTTWQNSFTFKTIPPTDPSMANVIVVGYTNPHGDSPGGSSAEEVWLIAYNRSPGTPIEFQLEFAPALGLPGGGTEPQIFRPYRFGVVDAAYRDILAFDLNDAGSIIVPGERVAFFKREPYVEP